jgi:hypothetical protein
LSFEQPKISRSTALTFPFSLLFIPPLSTLPLSLDPSLPPYLATLLIALSFILFLIPDPMTRFATDPALSFLTISRFFSTDLTHATPLPLPPSALDGWVEFERELQEVNLSNHLEKDILPTPSLAAARAHDEAFIEEALAWLKAQNPNLKEHLTVFNTESVLKVVHALFEPAARRHRQARAGDPAVPRATAKGTNLGDRHLLLGVKGVGKTCLTRGIVDYIGSLGTATPVIGVYHDYSRDYGRWQRPAALIWDALWARVNVEHGESAVAKAKEDALEKGLHEASSPSDISQFAFIRFRYFFYVAFDEISELYVPLSDPNAQCGRNCISDMLDIGKNAPTTAAVLTGSARMTKYFAFRLLDNFDDAIKARGQNYADLNHSVYHALPLHPLRTQDEIEAVVGAEEAAMCFYNSGGIGRALSREVPTAQALPAPDTPKRALIEALLLRQSLVRVEDDKVFLNQEMVTSMKSDPWTQSYSMTYSAALDVLKQLRRYHVSPHKSERTGRAGTAAETARRTGSQGVSAVLGTGWVKSAKIA